MRWESEDQKGTYLNTGVRGEEGGEDHTTGVTTNLFDCWLSWEALHLATAILSPLSSTFWTKAWRLFASGTVRKLLLPWGRVTSHVVPLGVLSDFCFMQGGLSSREDAPAGPLIPPCWCIYLGPLPPGVGSEHVWGLDTVNPAGNSQVGHSSGQGTWVCVCVYVDVCVSVCVCCVRVCVCVRTRVSAWCGHGTMLWSCIILGVCTLEFAKHF